MENKFDKIIKLQMIISKWSKDKIYIPPELIRIMIKYLEIPSFYVNKKIIKSFKIIPIYQKDKIMEIIQTKQTFGWLSFPINNFFNNEINLDIKRGDIIEWNVWFGILNKPFNKKNDQNRHVNSYNSCYIDLNGKNIRLFEKKNNIDKIKIIIFNNYIKKKIKNSFLLKSKNNILNEKIFNIDNQEKIKIINKDNCITFINNNKAIQFFGIKKNHQVVISITPMQEHHISII